MIGDSQCGIRLDEKDSKELYKLDMKFKQLSIYTSVVGCDSFGSCASWG